MEYCFKIEKELKLIPRFRTIYKPNLKIHKLKPVILENGIEFRGIVDDVFKYNTEGDTKYFTKFLLYNFTHLISIEGLNPEDVKDIDVISIEQEFNKTDTETVMDIIKIWCNIRLFPKL